MIGRQLARILFLWPVGKAIGLGMGRLCFLGCLAGSIVAAAGGVGAGTNEFPEFRFETARDYLQTGLDRALAQGGTNADTCLIRARLYHALGQAEQAKQCARQGLGLDPQRADLFVFLADLCVREDRMEEAVDSLRKAVSIQPQVRGGWRLLGMALDRLGDHAGAEAAFSKALAQQPEDVEARLAFGRMLMEQGRPREAVEELEKACKSSPRSANSFYVLSRARRQAGDPAGAEAALKEFNRLHKAEADQERAAASTLAGQGISLGDKELRASAVGFHLELADLLIRQGQAAAAESHLRLALRLAPDQPVACRKLAVLCVTQGRLSDAKILFADLVRLRPEVASFRVDLATVLLQLRDPGAIPELQRALAIDPNHPEGLYNLVRAYLTGHQHLPEALELCERLVACQPKASSYDLLGWALYSNNRAKEALDAATQAVERDPGNEAYRERQRKLEHLLGAAKEGN